jgi:hypothetical protein
MTTQSKKKKTKQPLPIEYKTEEDRKAELMENLQSMTNNGLSCSIDGFSDLLKVFNKYVKEGESAKGYIMLHGLKRIAKYDFKNVKGQPTTVVLKYAPDV